MAAQSISHGKDSEVEMVGPSVVQHEHLSRVPTIEVNNYHGLTWKTILVYMAILAVAFGEMMVIVSSGLLPRSMVAELGGADKIQWLPQAVPITNLALAAPVSRIADYWGRKWPMVGSCIFGIVGSIIVSRAVNMPMAIAGTVLASISTAAQPLLWAIAAEILPRRVRPAAGGGVNGTFAIAAIVALLMGSALTRDSTDHWRIVWYFIVGCFTFALIVTVVFYNPLPREEQVRFTLREKLAKLDWVGILLLPIAVTVFVIGLTWSDNPYPWNDSHVIAPFTIGLFLVICVALYEIFVKKDGLFHHDLFRHDRNLAVALFLIFVEGMAFFVVNSYMPLEVSILFQTNPILVGLNFCIIFIGTAVGTAVASIYCSWFKSLRWPLVVSYCGFVLFYALMMSVGLNDGANVWGYCVFLGLGFGGCLVVIVVAAQFSAPPELLAVSSGTLIVARSAGAAICLPIANAIFNSQLTKFLPADIAGAVLPLGFSSSSLGLFIQALTSQDDQALAMIPGVTPDIINAGVLGMKEAYIKSFRAVHGLGLSLSAIAVLASLFIVESKKEFTMHIDAPLDGMTKPDDKSVVT